MNLIKRGLVRGQAKGAGLLNRGENLEYILEVEELKRASNLSKIKILEVTGVRKNLHHQIKAGFPQWIPTSRITKVED